MKMNCQFCQKNYNLKPCLHKDYQWTIDCQFCLVDFYWKEVASQFILVEICYRLKDPNKLFDRLYICLDKQTTAIRLNLKQKQIKILGDVNRIVAPYTLIFDGITNFHPSEALKLAYRYKNLISFS